MRSVPALVLVILAGPLAAQSVTPVDVTTTINEPELAGGLDKENRVFSPLPDDIAMAVDAENASARPEVDAVTLADMQEALRAVSINLQTLRAELLASGADGFSAAGGDSVIDRMNAAEAQIAALTDQTEQLSNQIRRAVSDGTNRISDLEFRLCELDSSCDLGALMTSELGQRTSLDEGAESSVSGAEIESLPVISAVTLPPLGEQQYTAVPPTEEEDQEFAAVRADIDAKKWMEAIGKLDHFISEHTSSPLIPEALFLRGMAFQATDQNELAARSWLSAYSIDPDGPRAPESLIALSRVMATLGKPTDACPYFNELTRLFSKTAEGIKAQAKSDAIGCAGVTEESGAD